MALTPLSSQLARASLDLSEIHAKSLNLTLIKLKEKRRRLGLLTHSCKHLATYGPDVNLVIEPPTSEEASGEDHFETSYQYASEHLIDTALLKIKPKEETVEKWVQRCAMPTFLLTDLDPNLPLHTLKKAVNRVGKGLKRTAIVDLAASGRELRCGLISVKPGEEGEE